MSYEGSDQKKPIEPAPGCVAQHVNAVVVYGAYSTVPECGRHSLEGRGQAPHSFRPIYGVTKPVDVERYGSVVVTLVLEA